MAKNYDLKGNFANTVKEYLMSFGYEPMGEGFYPYMYEWLNWYKGKVEDFHQYMHYNGISYKSKERYTLGMPKIICEEWASKLFNDKVYFHVGYDEKTKESKDSDKFVDILNKNRFFAEFADLVELTFSLGTGATVVYKDSLNSTKINYYYAPMIFPLETVNGEIVSCAFASILGDVCYVNIHKLEPTGIYKISNKYFKIKNKQIIKVIKEGVQQSYHSAVKMFQIYKPCIKNNIDIFSPFGISVYANYIDTIKTCDIIYDSFRNDFQQGKKKIMVKTDALQHKLVINEKGKEELIPIFDENETEYFAIPGDDQEGDIIEEINPVLRPDEHTSGMQTNLNILGKQVGFGIDYFSFKDGKVYTNETQVINTRSDLYSNIKKHEKMLEHSLIELIRSVMFAENNIPYADEITIDFDDSIIEDTSEKKRQAMLELNAGLIDKVQYYQDVYGMTPKQAQDFYNEVQSRMVQTVEEEPPIDESNR